LAEITQATAQLETKARRLPELMVGGLFFSRSRRGFPSFLEAIVSHPLSKKVKGIYCAPSLAVSRYALDFFSGCDVALQRKIEKPLTEGGRDGNQVS